MKYLFLAISAFALAACQTETPMEWQLQRSFRVSAERECKDKKGTERYSKCVEHGIKASNEWWGEVQARHLGVKKR